MLDLSEKGSDPEDMSSKCSSKNSSEESQSQITELKKSCADCGTTKTPLWRGGPAGPKSLCNACGIRSRKKRRAVLGLNKPGSDDRKSKKTSIIRGNNNSSSKLSDSMKRGLFALGREVMLQRSSKFEKMRKHMGEEEQAAVLLMALSCGSVYA